MPRIVIARNHLAQEVLQIAPALSPPKFLDLHPTLITTFKSSITFHSHDGTYMKIIATEEGANSVEILFVSDPTDLSNMRLHQISDAVTSI